jgi:hypothetical protein
MSTCTICEGTGKQTVHSSILSFDEKAKVWRSIAEPPVKITCVGCGGTGRMTAAQEAVAKYEREMWCQCGAPMGVRFYDDNEHPVLTKHHYRCLVCRGVTQIG